MKTIKYLLSICAILSLSILSFSCMDEDDQRGGKTDGTVLQLTISASGTTPMYPMTKAEGLAVDTTVTNLNILVYDTDGNLMADKSKYIDGDFTDLNSGKQRSVSIDLFTNATGKIYVVANNGNMLASPVAQTTASLESLTFNLANAIKPVPVMFAKGQSYDVSNSAMNKIDATLIRIYSMITVKLDVLGLNQDVQITPQTLQLKHIPYVGQLADNNRITDASECLIEGPMLEKGDNADFLLVEHDKASQLFMYENNQPQGSNGGDQTTKTPNGLKPDDIVSIIKTDRKCSYIELIADYVGASGSGKITYRFFLGKDELKNFEVNRNTHYMLTLSLKGNGGVDEASWRVETDLLGEINAPDVYLGYRAGSKTRMYITGTGIESIKDISTKITHIPKGGSDKAFIVSPIQTEMLANGKKRSYVDIEADVTNTHDYDKKIGQVTFSIDGNGIQKDFSAKVYQVPRLVDPIAIYKRAENDEETEIIVREYNPDTTPGQYVNLVSKGPWSAKIQASSAGNWYSIYFKDKTTGKYKALSVGETIEGEGEVRFWYKPNNPNKNNAEYNSDRHGMILVKYHNEWCEHEIFLRQGYRPVDMGGENSPWSAFNCLGEENSAGIATTSPTQTGWLFNAGVNKAMHPFLPGYRDLNTAILYSDGTRGKAGKYDTNVKLWERGGASDPQPSSSEGLQGPCPAGYVVPNAWAYRKMTDATEVFTGYIYDDDNTGTKHENANGSVTYGWGWGPDGNAFVDDNIHSNPAKGSLFVNKTDKCTNLFFGYGKGVLTSIKERDSKLVAEIGVGRRYNPNLKYEGGGLSYNDYSEDKENHYYGGFYWNATNFKRFLTNTNVDYHTGKVDFGYDVFNQEPNLIDVPGKPASIGGGTSEGIDGRFTASFVRCVKDTRVEVIVREGAMFMLNGNPFTYDPRVYITVDNVPAYHLNFQIKDGLVISDANLGKFAPNAMVKFACTSYHITLPAKDINGRTTFELSR